MVCPIRGPTSGRSTGDVGRGSWDWSAGPAVPPTPLPGNGSLPVTYVGLDEARAYCKAAGKRLPHDEEWQYAGQGSGPDAHTRATPWGGAGGMGTATSTLFIILDHLSPISQLFTTLHAAWAMLYFVLMLIGC